jgi:hypothetical protein
MRKHGACDFSSEGRCWILNVVVVGGGKGSGVYIMKLYVDFSCVCYWFWTWNSDIKPTKLINVAIPY